MHLQQLNLTQFKAYDQAELSFNERVVAFTGPNGAGKTNLLDAIHYLCIGKSYFNPIDLQNVKHGSDFLRLVGKMKLDEGEERSIVCVYEPGKRKRIEVDKIPVGKLSEHFGQYPVVVIAPDDINLINGGSEGRRRFLDFSLAFSDRHYLDQLNQFNKLLTQRNALLKEMASSNRYDPTLLEAYNQKLAPVSEALHQARMAFVAQFQPIFGALHRTIVDRDEEATLRYDSELTGTGFSALMEANLDADRALQRTTKGVHRDDLQFFLDGHELKKFGSQGQKKSALIALKLAQYRFLEEHTGRKPLLLLDDLFDKLDNQRVTHLLDLIADGSFGQVFITDTETERVSRILGKLPLEFDTFEIEEGRVLIR